MSDLKHQTPERLRCRIRVAKAYKEQLEASIPVMERQIADLRAAITESKVKANNQHQIAVWAQYWINEKEGVKTC